MPDTQICLVIFQEQTDKDLNNFLILKLTFCWVLKDQLKKYNKSKEGSGPVCEHWL